MSVSHDRTVRFYGDERRLYEEVGAFLGQGITRGDAIIVIATLPHHAAFERMLGGAGFDVPALKASGQFVALDAIATLSEFMVGGLEKGIPSSTLFRRFCGNIMRSLSARYQCIRGYGEMVSILHARGNHIGSAWLQRLWHEEAGTLNLDLYNTYRLASDQQPGLAFLQVTSTTEP